MSDLAVCYKLFYFRSIYKLLRDNNLVFMVELKNLSHSYGLYLQRAFKL